MNERQRSEALGVGLLALGVLLALAIVPAVFRGGEAEPNLIGPAGAILSHLLLIAVGGSAVLFAAVPFVWSIRFFDRLSQAAAVRWSIFLGVTILFVPSAWWLVGRSLGRSAPGAGWLGSTIGSVLLSGFGAVGSQLIVFAVLISLTVLTFGWSPADSAGTAVRGANRGAVALVRRVRGLWPRVRDGLARVTDRGPEAGSESPWDVAAVDPEPDPEPATVPKPKLPRKPAPPEDHYADAQLELADTGDPSRGDIPPLDFLMPPERRGSGLEKDELKRLGELLVSTLKTFSVESSIGGWTTGPVVTQFEVVPAAGVKVGKIVALSDDLALALKAPSVRIVAPIPGKGAVGVEVPNPQPEIVRLREILDSQAYQKPHTVLPLGLGRDLAGNPYCADLVRMPHLLIAGATGSGKSVCINTIITSLVYRYPPSELRLLMIDPKMVELIIYNDLPHLRHPVVTDNNDAASLLRWVVFEMNRRLALLSANAVRNIIEINQRIRRGAEIAAPLGSGRGGWTEGPLPYIVVIIDELADLIMTVQSEVETPLAILAQKSRAVGIHLVVATQRPSVNVITGLIKANFPSRIAFRVASKIDSRTILDQNGAESLLGNGDMLFLPPGEADPHRIQGAFISTEETEAIVEWYRQRATGAEERCVAGEQDILEQVREIEIESSQVGVGDQILTDWDEYFYKAAEIVINNDAGSTSLLQRRLKIGYGRAARIVDQLHSAGVLGPPDGSKPREVLTSLDRLEAMMRGEDLLDNAPER
ncbi:MAG: DNA translocase FtsK [Gemmatimonadales bacterium]|nr:MAG: DNA translocase FtsK [Gemmatimonadales bacterium]